MTKRSFLVNYSYPKGRAIPHFKEIFLTLQEIVEREREYLPQKQILKFENSLKRLHPIAQSKSYSGEFEESERYAGSGFRIAFGISKVVKIQQFVSEGAKSWMSGRYRSGIV